MRYSIEANLEFINSNGDDRFKSFLSLESRKDNLKQRISSRDYRSRDCKFLKSIILYAKAGIVWSNTQSNESPLRLQIKIVSDWFRSIICPCLSSMVFHFQQRVLKLYYLCLNIAAEWMLWIKQLDHQREWNDKTIGPTENRILMQHVRSSKSLYKQGI